MEFLWHPEAVAEADAAANFYRNQRRELARRFINHLEEALNRIAINPEIYREVESGIRKIKLKTFCVRFHLPNKRCEHRNHRRYAHTPATWLLERPYLSTVTSEKPIGL